MSTGLECRFIEAKPLDWREHATAYGPFDTEDEAVEHLVGRFPGLLSAVLVSAEADARRSTGG